jgi:hypothetical protein
MSGRTTVPTFASFIIIAFSLCAFSQTARAQRRGRVNEPQIDNLHAFIATLNIKCPVVWENIGFTDSLSSPVPGLHVLPQTFIIDKAGRLRKHFRGFNAEFTPALVREALDQVRAKDAIGPP